MFILPYIYTQTISASGLPIHKVQFFLAKGSNDLLSAEDPVGFCESNELHVIHANTHADIRYLEVTVDPNTFYTFHENGTENFEIWRTYLFIGDILKDPWNVNNNYGLISGRSVLELVMPVLRIRA